MHRVEHLNSVVRSVGRLVSVGYCVVCPVHAKFISLCLHECIVFSLLRARARTQTESKDEIQKEEQKKNSPTQNDTQFSTKWNENK